MLRMWNKFGETKCHSNLQVDLMAINFLNQLKKSKRKICSFYLSNLFFSFYEIIIFISAQVTRLTSYVYVH